MSNTDIPTKAYQYADPAVIEVKFRAAFHNAAVKSIENADLGDVHVALRGHDALLVTERDFSEETARESMKTLEDRTSFYKAVAKFTMSRIGAKDQFVIVCAKDKVPEIIEDLLENPVYRRAIESFSLHLPKF